MRLPEDEMFRKLWKDPVWSAVIAAAIIAIGVAIWTYARGTWPAIGAGLRRFWLWLGHTSDVANWLVLVLGACALLVFLAVAALAWGLMTSKPASDGSGGWRGYTKDQFFGLTWRWHYGSDGTILGLGSFCLSCDYQIRPVTNVGLGGDKTTFTCDDCRRAVGPIAGDFYDVQSQVERKIQKNLRNETWPRDEA